MHCSKGTYIRTLAEDIGAALGCGAYISALRRTGVGNYLASQMISLSDLENLISTSDSDPSVCCQPFILPIHTCLTHFPDITVTDTLLFYLQRGQAVQISSAPSEGWVKLFTTSGDFVGIGEVLDDGRITPRRLAHVL